MRTYLALLLGATVAIYLVCAFVAWSWNPSDWSDRILAACAWLASAWIIGAACMDSGCFRRRL